MKHSRWLGTSSLLAVLATLPSHAATLTFQQGVAGYFGTSDTFLHSFNPDENFDTWITAEAEKFLNPQFPVAHALLRFDSIFGNAPGMIVPGSEIQEATLRFGSHPVIQGFTGTSSTLLHVHRMLVDWNAGSTWGSFVNGVQTDGSEAAIASETDIAMPTASMAVDVTPSLNLWSANPTSNRGWVFIVTSDQSFTRYAFEQSNGSGVAEADRPLLSVTYRTADVPLMASATSGLARIAPNPAATWSRIDYDVAREQHVKISIVDVAGREMDVLVDGIVPAGRHSAVWSARGDRLRRPHGVYYVRYRSDDATAQRRIVLIP